MKKVKRQLRQNIFILLVILVSLAFFFLVKGFLLAIFWALVLAIVFRNTYRKLRIRYRGKKDGWAAFLTTSLILSVVIIPIVLVSVALINQSLSLYEQIKSGNLNLDEMIDKFIAYLPSEIEEYLGVMGPSMEDVKTAFKNFGLKTTDVIANKAWTSTQNAINFFAQFFLMLYMLYFFLKDGDAIGKAIVNNIPMGNRRERKLLRRFVSVTKATLRGTLIVAIVQGTMGGILFWAVGIKSAVFWGVMMTLLSLLPIGGSALIWIPAAALLLIDGEVVRGIAVILVGSLVIGLVDNILRPRLVGRDTKMPDYLVLLSTLGGIGGYGLSGFILGPVIAALFITCWEMMGNEFGGREN